MDHDPDLSRGRGGAHRDPHRGRGTAWLVIATILVLFWALGAPAIATFVWNSVALPLFGLLRSLVASLPSLVHDLLASLGTSR